MDAVYLLGCYFSQLPCFAELEPFLLTETLSGISNGLRQSDRLVDITSASCLIALYHYAKGQIVEGYRHCFTAVRLAITLGLHQISTEEPFFKPDAFGVLPPACDTAELRDRISVFWQVLQMDRSWSVVNGLPTALPDDHTDKLKITTPLPKPANQSVRY